MKLLKDIKTKTYEVEHELYNGFMVDIVESEELFEAYLYHKNYGVKMSVFGTMKEAYKEYYGKPETLNGFSELVESVLKNDNYIPMYISRYIDIDEEV